MPAKIVLSFERHNDTKRMRRYKELVDGDATPVVGYLYIRKDIAEKVGDVLDVSIENGAPNA